jgi:cupin 2 domain-containing protein
MEAPLKGNLFEDIRFPTGNAELFEIIRNDKVRIERIISTGQTTPEGEWYDQDEDEFVVLMQGQARIKYQEGNELLLTAGDYVMIPSHTRHRVSYTSEEPCCVWMAIYGDL